MLKMKHITFEKNYHIPLILSNVIQLMTFDESH